MRYFLGFLASIGLIVLVFILVLRGFGGKSTQQNQTPLTSYASSDTTVRMTVDGPIVGDQQHQAYRITVGRDQITLETLQGYQYSPIDTKMYENNQDAYANFLQAIDLDGFSKGVANPDSTASDERGVCPNGQRFVFEIDNGASQVERYWSTSCGGKGTFKGNTNAVKQLFDRQVPLTDFSKEIGHLNL
jgi:hypothetical protein